ncbi:MAG TPA: CmcJ/NvfI family oxidoreductase [Sphingobium sp.]
MAAIKTRITYVVRGESAVFNAADRAASYWPKDLHDVDVHDLRPEIDALTFDRNGFVVANEPSDAIAMADPAARMAQFGSEAERLVGNLTGAKKVISFGGMYRTDAPDSADGNLPAFGAHVDYGARTVRDFTLDHIEAEEAERLLAGRHMLINVWRPLKTVERAPLALCDASTVSRDDLFPSEVVGGLGDARRRSLFGFNLAYNPAHRWTWLPHMQSNEAFVFRLYDSDPDAVQFTGHTAIDVPGTPADAAPRESLEIRTIAFLD